jgi:hypothetical protein
VLTSTTESPNSEDATYAKPAVASSATSYGVPTPGTNPTRSRSALAQAGVAALAAVPSADTLPALSTAAAR